MLFGGLQFEDFESVKPPQEVATAISGLEGWTGSSFKFIKFLAKQTCKGVNYWILAEMTLTDNPSTKKIVNLAINGFNGKYAIIPSSIEELKFEI